MATTMKTSPRMHPLPFALAALMAAPALATRAPAEQPVELPAYEVSSPKFSSPVAEFLDKLDNLFDSPWIDAQGGSLIQDIIWRHQYLAEHPSDQAIIYVDRSPEGRVLNATTIYSKNGALYANSYAMGSNVRLSGLTAADLRDTRKVIAAVDGIRDAYLLDASLEVAQFRGLGNLNFIRSRNDSPFQRGFRGPDFAPGGLGGYFTTTFQPVSGDFTVAGGGYGNPHGQELYAFAEFEGDTGRVVPFGLNPFYPGFQDPGWNDRYHEPPTAMLDTVYRALRDPQRAGLVPVALSRVPSAMRTRQGLGQRALPALVFDWEGFHYVYRPYRGTVGLAIPLNPVTQRPYLCVQDSGLLESIYFSATYLQAHPGEKAVLVASDTPSAAYTFNGKLCLFSPSLNKFVLLKAAGPDAIGNPAALASSVDRVKAVLALQPAPAARAGHERAGRVAQRLLGDTPDSQMRRIFLAFQQAGIPVHLASGESSSLTFNWQGVNYVYGEDQRLRTEPNG
jgi:hypothetical protein